MRPLELWAGIECTVNRVGDRYFEQMTRSGYHRRIDDLDRIAALGVRVLRHPFLWEHLQPDDPSEPLRFERTDPRAERMRALGVRPIAGLLHHGSGPRWTSLVDPALPERFAAFARRVAEHYPWIEDYTPVNEPLTTARFSGLYGVWYPHGRDDATFARALYHELLATVLAMRAIREVTPHARLIQTEDYGHITCSPGLEYQVEHQNTLRWLTFDLLCGKVDRAHPMWRYLTGPGQLTERELEVFLESPCPPDVLGVNHYMTSDRFLDLDLSAHPKEMHGGNGRHRYADVETVRVAPIRGHYAMLMDVWERYRRPVAVTEVHLDCAREEQLRWIWEAWHGAQRAQADGADVRAITLWALFGSFDWNCLVTADRGYYEPGAFDVRAPVPRPTAIARIATSLATTGTFTHPALAEVGWWRRRHRQPSDAPFACQTGDGRPVLITGATGTLGRAMARICEARGLAHRMLRRDEVDITSPDDIARAVDALDPWAIVNAAGYVRVDDAEDDAGTCFAWNTKGARLLAEACARRGLRFLTFSSDLVFDGERDAPYVESDAPAPLNVYGASKALAERQVLETCERALVVRTSAFFGPWDEHNFVYAVLRALARGEEFRAAGDLTVSPTYVPALVGAALDLLVDEERGVWHLANDGACTWAELARRAAIVAQLDATLVRACRAVDLGLRAPRPRYSALRSERQQGMPSLDASLLDYARTTASTWARR